MTPKSYDHFKQGIAIVLAVSIQKITLFSHNILTIIPESEKDFQNQNFRFNGHFNLGGNKKTSCKCCWTHNVTRPDFLKNSFDVKNGRTPNSIPYLIRINFRADNYLCRCPSTTKCS